MRWGKPRKNTKREDPRYFLHEQNQEKLFIKNLEKAIADLSDEELLSEQIEEVDDPRQDALVKKDSEKLILSDESKKYIINFARRRALGAISFKLRTLLLASTKVSMGTILIGLAVAGYGPKKIMQVTSVDSLDKIADKVFKKHLPEAHDVLYPGDTDLKTLAKALVQEFMRFFETSATKKMKSLPEPEQKQLKKQVTAQLQQFKKSKNDNFN